MSNRVKDFPNSRVSERECVKMCWTRDVSLEEEADGPLSLISTLLPTLMCVGLVLLILAVAGYYVHDYFMSPAVVASKRRQRDSKSKPKSQPKSKVKSRPKSEPKNQPESLPKGQLKREVKKEK